MKASDYQGQSFLEYAFVLVVVVAAFISLQIYAKRAIQGRLRLYSEELGEQYSPRQTNANISSTMSLSATEATTISRPTPNTKDTTTTINTTENSQRIINQTVVRE